MEELIQEVKSQEQLLLTSKLYYVAEGLILLFLHPNRHLLVLLKINNENTRTMSEICSKLTMQTI